MLKNTTETNMLPLNWRRLLKNGTRKNNNRIYVYCQLRPGKSQLLVGIIKDWYHRLRSQHWPMSRLNCICLYGTMKYFRLLFNFSVDRQKIATFTFYPIHWTLHENGNQGNNGVSPIICYCYWMMGKNRLLKRPLF